MSDEYSSLFRSEQMSLVQLFVPTEVAHDTVAELGELGDVQFKDLNPNVNPFQRSFVGEIRRIDEMARRVRFFMNQIEKEKDVVPIRPLYDSAPLITVGPRAARTMDELEIMLTEHESRLIKMNESYQTLSERTKELVEARHVLRETAVFFEKAQAQRGDIRSSFDDSSTPLLHDDRENQLSTTSLIVDLEFIAGTIERSRIPIFERVLWLYKNVFIIFAHGDTVLAKIRKVAESMGATLYPIDANADKRSAGLREVSDRLEDLEVVLYQTGLNRRSELVTIGENLRSWQVVVRKEKMIYETLNLFNYDVRRKTLIAEGWVPTRDITRIQLALKDATEQSGTSIPPILHELRTHKTPPTYHRTNKFTEGFQAIMDNYGVAAYQEVNPGLFAIVTFPFLFAVMFGDIGHGFIIFIAALYMILSEKRLRSQPMGEIMSQFFFGRYIILLMGAFSMYTGTSTGHTYPFGVDPGWHGAENALVFTNSYKMKMSVILGMTFALCLQLPNHLKFKRRVDIYGNFLPQIIFLQSIFGYLVACILYKWSIDWSKAKTQPPSLLNMLITMFLQPGKVNPATQLYPAQPFVQVVLLLMAAVCVPWMLITKPYVIWKETKKIQGQGYMGLQDEAPRDSSDEVLEGEEEGNGRVIVESSEANHEQHSFSDVVIHQIIHTIEFCLGVLWSMTIGGHLHPTSIGDFIGLVLMGFLWINMTIGGLCLMEGLSAFLHAVRLHWVEANSKHFEGGGHAFTPLSFADPDGKE
ncbi:V-type ATPase, V0 complex, 116kDa subunit family [Amanita rubescens]|nr:V-type ATPase, V0 complex, 116kDa subunit family [Amanita rubescens]